MTDTPADTELREYTATVPKAYIVLAWVWVAIPFGYGLYELLIKAGKLFSG